MGGIELEKFVEKLFFVFASLISIVYSDQSFVKQ